MLKKSFTLLTIVIITIIACKKDEIIFPFVDKDEKSCIDTSKLVCNGISADAKYYFKAKIDGTPVCYEVGRDNYENFMEDFRPEYIENTSDSPFPSIRVRFGIKRKDEFEIGNSSHFFVTLAAPNDSFMVKMLDQYLVKGDLKRCQKDYFVSGNKDSLTGFDIGFRYLCSRRNCTGCSSDYIHIAVSFGAINGESDNGFMRCTDVVKTEDNNATYYDVKLEFEAKLFRDKRGERFWSNLTEGELSTQIVVPKSL